METIIVAVCGYLEIFDTTSYLHRERTLKEIVWRKISEEVGLTEETIRRKRKGLRDTYVKEKKETERKSGSGASQGKRWKYSALLSFLFFFEENRTAEYTGGPDRSQDTTASRRE
ncbi:hypothetical protein PO909_002422 [Leuciscus waleckii]